MKFILVQKEGKSSNVFNDISKVKSLENERIKTMYYIIFGILVFFIACHRSLFMVELDYSS